MKLHEGGLVPQDVMAHRLDACLHCDKLEVHKADGDQYGSLVCPLCECFVRAKVFWEDESCPNGKWTKHARSV